MPNPMETIAKLILPAADGIGARGRIGQSCIAGISMGPGGRRPAG